MTTTPRTTPAEWADQAAQAVRSLNHATINLATDGSEGYRFPADVDETLANLQALVERLPQALEQMTRWLDRQARAGLVRHDGVPADLGRGTSVQRALVAVVDLAEDLAAAGAGLAAVGWRLEQARNQSSHLAAFLEDLPDDPDDALPVDDLPSTPRAGDVDGRWSGQSPLPQEWDGVTDAQDACSAPGWDDVLGIPAVCHRRIGHPGRHMSAWVTPFAGRPPAIFCAWPGTTPPTLNDLTGGDVGPADGDGAR